MVLQKAVSGLQGRKLTKAWQAVLRNSLVETVDESETEPSLFDRVVSLLPPASSANSTETASGDGKTSASASASAAAAGANESAGRLRKTDSSNDADDKEAEVAATSSNRQFFLHGVLREFAVLKAGGAEGNQGLLSDE